MNTFGPLSKIAGHSRYLSNIRLVVLCFLMLTVLGIISARIVELNIIYGRQNRLRADQNRILIKPISAYRGVILDRHGTALTRNIPIERLVDLPGDDSGPVTVESVGRIYPFGAALAHVVGYLGEASAEDIKNSSLKLQDLIGKSGLEKYYDSTLRGQDGAQLIEIDANGQTIRVAGEESPISGRDIKTSLDINLQKIIVEKMANRRGAAVALDPTDGSILALVSSPAFDPNLFQSNNDPLQFNKLQEILNDTENLPLFNRAISGAYPPGSIFKLVTATAGLVENKIDANTRVDDTGEIKIGDFRYGNWYFDQYGRTEGSLDIVKAITRSNDIFFYKVGEWVGADKLSKWAKNFGLGDKLGIDLPGENGGLIPDLIWKERQTGERWFLGNTYHMAIGQGDVELTPLQAADMVSSIITGQLCRPHIVSNPSSQSNPSSCHSLDLSPQNRNLITAGMVGVCSTGGTAFPFFGWNEHSLSSSAEATKNALPTVACKTGTAQHGGQETLPHAWITVAGPITDNTVFDGESPKRIVLVVLLESAGEGSAAAGPVAKEILTEWFK